MMLEAVSHMLDLPEPVIRMARPRWGFAETVNLAGMTGLLCYQSPAIRPDDPAYADVAHLLDRSRVEPIYEASRRDDRMMFGKAMVSIYLLDPIPVSDLRVITFLDLVSNWGEPVGPERVPAKLRQRLQPSLD